MDHSTSVFSTFDMDQSGKIRRLHWNERLKISEIAKSESDTSYASEDIALSKDCRRSFVWWGGEGGGGGVGWQVCSPHHTNVCKISRLWEAISSLVFNNSLSNLAILLILRRSFHVVSTNFPNLPTSKIEKEKEKKNRGRVYWKLNKSTIFKLLFFFCWSSMTGHLVSASQTSSRWNFTRKVRRDGESARETSLFFLLPMVPCALSLVSRVSCVSRSPLYEILSAWGGDSFCLIN